MMAQIVQLIQSLENWIVDKTAELAHKKWSNNINQDALGNLESLLSHAIRSIVVSESHASYVDWKRNKKMKSMLNKKNN